MDLSFNQFSLTEQLGLFSEKEVQQLLICCLIAPNLLPKPKAKPVAVHLISGVLICQSAPHVTSVYE